ncbi:thermonuclease family protein [Dysgonomonas massiliensis]|uniref:thermonuclease family protein n=1 Tax=Dysgonomonas massiliensis TaxID=2040292 RepID=UPI000C75E043|nr:thermonuclease family protein [Dysgonomonas massiliensis]
MTKYIILLLIVLSLPIQSKTLKGKIVRVSDGDTIVLLDSTNTQHRIRLDGIDCPEKGQPFGRKATDFLKELTTGKTIIVEWEKKDRYNRILGVVYADNINVNKELLKNGLAWHYKHFNNDQELADLEQQAKDKKLNIWSEKNPIEPYRWRKGDRN